MKLKEIEKLLVDHLKESGEIRGDLKWLKKGYWFLLASPVATEVIKHLWR
jgi:hypothetical protein